jgi:hypothetical protein
LRNKAKQRSGGNAAAGWVVQAYRDAPGWRIGIGEQRKTEVEAEDGIVRLTPGKRSVALGGEEAIGLEARIAIPGIRRGGLLITEAAGGDAADLFAGGGRVDAFQFEALADGERPGKDRAIISDAGPIDAGVSPAHFEIGQVLGEVCSDGHESNNLRMEYGSRGPSGTGAGRRGIRVSGLDAEAYEKYNPM